MRKLFHLDLKFDRNTVIITILSTLLLILDRYHTFTSLKAVDRVCLYLLIPLLTVVIVFRESPREYGFRVGDWRAGLALTGLAIAVIAPVLWLLTQKDPAMQSYYGRQLKPLTPLITFLDLIGWEFFFRGFILFGYARVFGDHALWLHAVPFALAHLGKPEIETVSTIFGGFLFGLVAWRTRSFFYPFLIHWFVATFTILVAGGVFQ
jgi:membrane protease YdiL (CAAX protease family)